jgi:hypothetical protein
MYTVYIKVPQLKSACLSKNHAMSLTELSTELRERIASRHISGEVYQIMSAALKFPKNTVPDLN